jgi:hypothetical protein
MEADPLNRPLHGGCQPPPLGSGHHHVDVAAATPGTDQPLAPFENCGLGAIASGGIGPHLAATNPGHHTLSRTRAAAALPSVIGGPGSDFARVDVVSSQLARHGAHRPALTTLETVNDSPTKKKATVAAPVASPCRRRRGLIAGLPTWTFGSHIRASLDCQYCNTIIHNNRV